MKPLSKAMITSGTIIALLSACCIDSDGIYGYAAGISCMLGLIIIITGFSVGLKNILTEEIRIKDFYNTKRKDRLDTDVEFLNGSDTTNVL